MSEKARSQPRRRWYQGKEGEEVPAEDARLPALRSAARRRCGQGRGQRQGRSALASGAAARRGLLGQIPLQGIESLDRLLVHVLRFLQIQRIRRNAVIVVSAVLDVVPRLRGPVGQGMAATAALRRPVVRGVTDAGALRMAQGSAAPALRSTDTPPGARAPRTGGSGRYGVSCERRRPSERGRPARTQGRSAREEMRAGHERPQDAPFPGTYPRTVRARRPRPPRRPCRWRSWIRRSRARPRARRSPPRSRAARGAGGR